MPALTNLDTALAAKPFTPPSSPTASTASPRLNALDGLRACAVIPVVALHLSLNRFIGGGQYGVVLFFVLSGYLITTGLLVEHHRYGRINLRRFYSKRFWRLAPAIVLIIGIGLIGSATAWPRAWGGLPAILPEFLASAGSSIGQFLNIAMAGNYSLAYELVPLWSLNIEEQFYLGWALIVVGALQFGSARLVALTAATGAFVSLGWCWYLASTGTDQHRYAYATDTQLGPVLIGCLLAVALQHQNAKRFFRRFAGLLGWIATIVIAVFLSGNILNLPVYSWGQGVLALTSAVAIAVLAANHSGFGSRLLGNRILVWIGRRSYGIYLFHVTVIQWSGGPGDWKRSSLVIVITLLLAAFSWRFVEQPLIRWANHRRIKPELSIEERAFRQWKDSPEKLKGTTC